MVEINLVFSAGFGAYTPAELRGGAGAVHYQGPSASVSLPAVLPAC